APPRLSVVYYTVPKDCFEPRACPGIDVWLASSRDGGQSWRKPQRLNAESMALAWLARTTGSFFVGDYVSTSFANGQAVPVFVLASAPIGGRLRQAGFAPAPRGPAG